MDDRFNMLSGLILQKPLDQCSVTELEELASAYPFFAPAHFLLIKKKEEEGADTSALLQKTMLYYHDPVSFAHFLHQQKTDERFLHEEPVRPVPITPAFTPHPSPPEPDSVDTIAEDKHEIPTLPEAQTEQRSLAGQPVEATSLNEPPDNIPAKAEEALAFEPYHTVDYFASQGIKPSKEEPKDALGRQLKSFTEWLKTMKKLPDASSTAAKPTDPVVEAMASRSVGDTVVVTEAMAEVWIKQGNKERAREIYRKLSLLDPSKSPYFAAKIDNLNAD